MISNLFMRLLLPKFGKGFVLLAHGIQASDCSNVVDRPTQIQLSEFIDVIKLLQAYNYTFISMDQLSHFSKDIRNAPKHWVHITFDDGYLNNLIIVKPLLKSMDIPWSIFISTQHIVAQERMFTYRIRCSLLHTQSNINIPNTGFSLSTTSSIDERLKFIGNVISYYKSLSPKAARQLVAYCDSLLSPTEWNMYDKRYASHEILSRNDLISLCDDTNIHIGSHNLTHTILNSKASTDEMLYEMHCSSRWIQNHVGSQPKAYAFPDGQFNSLAKHICNQVGYNMAFTTFGDYFCNAPDSYELPRFTLKPSRIEKIIHRSVLPKGVILSLKRAKAAMVSIAAWISGLFFG